MNPAFRVEQVVKRFGGLVAVDQVSLEVGQGSLTGLIGPNGAGKTTLFNLMTGVYPLDSGSIEFFSQSITGLATHEITRMGLARTFQNIRLFKNLSVIENARMGASQRTVLKWYDPLIRSVAFAEEERKLNERAEELLEMFGLIDSVDKDAGSLSYGQCRSLEIVRALMTNPKMICFDEPAAGMNESETHNLMDLIKTVRKKLNLTVLVIEHDMKFVKSLCEKIFVLDHGQLIASGAPDQVLSHEKVIEAYLGVDHD